MSHRPPRFVGCTLLLLASVLAMAGRACGEETKPPQAAPWNIQSVRQKYYSSLDAARQDAVRQIEAEGLTLSYNTDGTAVRDQAFDKATQYYNQKQQSLLSEVRGNGRREQEFQALSQSAGAKIKREGGAQPGEAAYSGALSDRDVELNTKAQVENLTEVARKQGYHVVSGPGYVKILELDTVVWEPFRSHGPAGVELRYDDPEVMLSYEVIVGKQKASVTQQVKKIEDLYREEIPNSTQKQHELVASLAKAVAKSADAIGQSASESGGVLDREKLNQYQLLKSRKLTKDDLISPFDSPEAQEQQLKEIRKTAGQDVRTCDTTQAEQRQQKIDRLKAEQAALSERLEKETDDGKRQQLKIEISDAADQVNAIERDLSVDTKTRRAISRKNPKLATAMGWNPKPDTVIPDRAGELAKISRVVDEALEISKQQEPRDTSATETFDAVADANRTIGKFFNSPFFKILVQVVRIPPSVIKLAETVGKGAKAADKNFISPTQDAIHSEGFVYATGDGMKEYIARRLKEEAAQGWDITDPRLQERIRLEAIARATALGTYEGAKNLPGLGDVIQGYENTFHLTESSVGLAYDTWKSQQTADMNRFQQEGQLEKAILQAKESRDRLRKQMDTAAKAVAYSKEIEKLLPGLNADIEQLQQQIKDRRTQLESLAPVDGQTSPPGAGIDPQMLAGLRARMEALTRLSKLFTADCEKAIAQVKSGKVPRDELLEERSQLQRRLMDKIDVEYIRIETLLDQVNARMRMATEPDEFQKIYETLLLDYGQALALASMAEEIAARLEHNQLLYQDAFRCFTEERKRILAACDFFSQRAVGDENLQKRLSQMRGEMTEYHIPDYQLDETWTQASSLKREASWLRKIASEPPKPPQVAAVSPMLRAECEQLRQLSNSWKQPEAAMTAAVEEARAKFRELGDLLPLEPPAFNLTANELKPQVWAFAVESVRVPPDAKLIYSWDFGDEAQSGGPESLRQHQYAKPGEYTVSVRVYLERKDLSEDLGEVSTRITMGDPMAKPPGTPGTTKPNDYQPGELQLTAEMKLEGADEFLAVFGKNQVGKWYSQSRLTLRFVPGARVINYNILINRTMTLNKVEGAFLIEPTWTLEIDHNGQAPFDPRTGKLELSLQNVPWKEEVPKTGFPVANFPNGFISRPLSPEVRAAMFVDAHRLLGTEPGKLAWSGQIDGTIDFQSFAGGTGRLELNPLVRGTWEIEPGRAITVRLPTDITGPNGRGRPILLMHPNIASAQRSFSRPNIMDGGRKNTPEMGDESLWSPYFGMLIRMGRWHLDMSRPPIHSQSPEQFRPILEKVRQFISDSGLETTIPEQPSR